MRLGGQIASPTTQPITSFDQGSSAGFYVVREGESLASIAAALYGDASLWYQIADINGLTANSTLSEGQILVLPAGVLKQTHNSKTFTPYDSNSAIGDTAPTTPIAPKPGRGKNCGGFGQVLLAVIAIAVTIWTAGAASTLAGSLGFASGTAGNAIVAGAVSGAAGSIASQSVGVATGIQDKFSWNAVALAAIGGGVGGAGIGNKLAKLAGVSGKFAVTAVGAGVNSAITQGIGVATGLQDKFSWAGVAAAGIGAGVFSKVGSMLPASMGDTARLTVASGAQVIADAASRSLIEGTDFGDNVLAALPNAIGSVVGSAIAGRIAGRSGDQWAGVEAQGDADESSLALDQYVALCQANANRRSTGFFQAIGDFLGFDGSFGYNGPTYGALTTENWGRAFGGSGPAPVYDDEIVVTGHRTYAPAAPGTYYTPPPSSWMQTITALGSAPQRWPSEYERNYPEGMAPRWTAGPSQFDLWQQRQTQLGMQGIANSMTGTGAVFQFGAGVAGADYEDQVRWGALGAGLEGVAGGMYGTPAFHRGRYSLSPYAIEIDNGAVNGMWRTPANPYNISTVGMTAAERASAIEYAQRTNAWLGANGPTTVQSTAGTLRSQASSAARTERLRAERAGTPYQGQAGHVPDTALTGSAQPPAGWLDMAGTSNNVIGGGLSSRIGQPVGIITVDGKVP